MLGDRLTCDGCGASFVFKGKCVESVHSDGIDFCTRGCMYRCLATGGKLHDGRIILTLGGRTPVEHLREIFRLHGSDPDGTALRHAEASWHRARGAADAPSSA